MNAAELIQSFPSRLKQGVAEDLDFIYHFRISGEGGGEFTVIIKDATCTVQSGLIGEPKCVVEAKADDYEDVEYGRTNAQMAVLLGKVKVSNIGSMLKFVEMFDKST